MLIPMLLNVWPTVARMPGRFALTTRSCTRLVGVPLVLESCATIVVKRALRLLSAFALTACATYSLQERGICKDVAIVVQANKRDLADALDLAIMREELGLGEGEDLVEAIASEGVGIQLTFMKALDRARDSVRETLRKSGISGLDSSSQKPEDLVAILRDEMENVDHEAYVVTDDVIRRNDI